MSTTPNAMPILTALRDALGAVDGIETSRIGLEANMTPADYPMVRIVPSRIGHAGVIGRRSADVLVYFGEPIHEFTSGLEAVYTSMLALEAALITAAETAPGLYCQYQETIADEDRVDGYKLMALRMVVEGA